MQHAEIDEEGFVERLLEGFHAEIENPTDEPEGEVTNSRGKPVTHRVKIGMYTGRAFPRPLCALLPGYICAGTLLCAGGPFLLRPR